MFEKASLTKTAISILRSQPQQRGACPIQIRESDVQKTYRYKTVLAGCCGLSVLLAGGIAGCEPARTQTATKDAGLQNLTANMYSMRVQNLPFRSRDEAINSEIKGIMRADDYAKLAEIGGKAADKQPLSDEDLNFTLHQIQSGPVKNVSDNWLQHYRISLGSLTGPKKITLAQATRLLAVVVPLATGTDRNIQGFAVPVLASIRDARVVPILEKIARESSDVKMQQFAGGSALRVKNALSGNKS